MDTLDEAPVYSEGETERTYLDVQATLGISKHMGGYRATDALYELCHVGEARDVLEVGCGIGVGPSYMASRFGCRVTAVDLSTDMLAWAEARARREGVRDRIVFRQADLRELPFDDDMFDAVIVESVLAFVADKAAAIAELARVTRPGGYVGVNESYWIELPPQRLLEYGASIGPQIVTEAEWRKLWEAAPLTDQRIRVISLTASQELRDRIQWIGWRSVLPAWGRAIRLLVSDRRFRTALKSQTDMPRELAAYLGDALFVGRKPLRESD